VISTAFDITELTDGKKEVEDLGLMILSAANQVTPPPSGMTILFLS